MIINKLNETKSIGSMFHLATCDNELEANKLVNKFFENGDYPAIRANKTELWVSAQNFERAREILIKS